MKTLLVAFALCIAGSLAALSKEQMARLKRHKELCIGETGVDPAVLEAAKKGTYTDGDEKLGCFAACVLKKIGIMEPDGTINEVVTRSKIPPDMAKEDVDDLINTCKGLTGANDCETAGKIFQCYLQHKTRPLLVN